MYFIKWPGAMSILHIPLERAGQHTDMARGICITSLGIELGVKMCNTGNISCEYYHILVHIFLNIEAIQIPPTVLECWSSAQMIYSSIL